MGRLKVILIDILITICLLTVGLLIDNFLGPVLIFFAGGWCMFTVWIERRGR